MNATGSHGRISGGSRPAGRLRSMKSFNCEVCGQLLFFDNSSCLQCGSILGFDPASLHLWALTAEGGVLRLAASRSLSFPAFVIRVIPLRHRMDPGGV